MQDGLDLNGMEGELMEVIEKYQGKQLSANLPYKTLFMIPKDDGKDQKLIAHLVRDNVMCTMLYILLMLIVHDAYQ